MHKVPLKAGCRLYWRLWVSTLVRPELTSSVCWPQRTLRVHLNCRGHSRQTPNAALSPRVGHTSRRPEAFRQLLGFRYKGRKSRVNANADCQQGQVRCRRGAASEARWVVQLTSEKRSWIRRLFQSATIMDSSFLYCLYWFFFFFKLGESDSAATFHLMGVKLTRPQTGPMHFQETRLMMSTFPASMGNRLECWGHGGAFSWNRGNIAYKASLHGKHRMEKLQRCLLNQHCPKTNLRVPKAAFRSRDWWPSASPGFAALSLPQSWIEREKVPNLALERTRANKSKTSAAFPMLEEHLKWQPRRTQLESFHTCVFGWNKSCCDVWRCRFLSCIQWNKSGHEAIPHEANNDT